MYGLIRRFGPALAVGFLLGMSQQVRAADPLADEIVRALTRGHLSEDRLNTRSLRTGTGSSAFTPRSFVENPSADLHPTSPIAPVKGTLLIQPGTEGEPIIQGAAEPEPPARLSFDLYVTFPFASHELTESAKNKLSSVANALNHPDLLDKNIQIAGHTDSVGTEENNMKLSIERAKEVRRFLSQTLNIDASRLQAVGYGETRLKNSADPISGVNRRVELVNLGNVVASAN